MARKQPFLIWTSRGCLVLYDLGTAHVLSVFRHDYWVLFFGLWSIVLMEWPCLSLDDVLWNLLCPPTSRLRCEFPASYNNTKGYFLDVSDCFSLSHHLGARIIPLWNPPLEGKLLLTVSWPDSPNWVDVHLVSLHLHCWFSYSLNKSKVFYLEPVQNEMCHNQSLCASCHLSLEGTGSEIVRKGRYPWEQGGEEYSSPLL